MQSRTQSLLKPLTAHVKCAIRAHKVLGTRLSYVLLSVTFVLYHKGCTQYDMPRTQLLSNDKHTQITQQHVHLFYSPSLHCWSENRNSNTNEKSSHKVGECIYKPEQRQWEIFTQSGRMHPL